MSIEDLKIKRSDSSPPDHSQPEEKKALGFKGSIVFFGAAALGLLYMMNKRGGERGL